MNKKLAEYLSANGLKYEKGKGFSGVTRGYQVSGEYSALRGIFASVAVHLSEEQAAQVKNWLTASKKAYEVIQADVTQAGFTCVFLAYCPIKKYVAFLEGAVEYLSQISAEKDACPFCGKQFAAERRFVGVRGSRFYAHEPCFDQFAEKVAQEERNAAAAPVYAGRGICGAVVGSLLGCIVWGLLYFVGYIAVVAAIITSLGAAFLWDKFGGKNCKAKIVAIWIVSVVMLGVTMFGVYCIDVLIEFNKTGLADYGISINVVEFLSTSFRDVPEFRNAILFDTVVSCLFVVIGNVFTTMRILKTQKALSKTLVKY